MLDFTDPHVAQQASWTHSASIKPGPHGLVGEESSGWMPFQLQTTEPFAIGSYWQAARAATIYAQLSPAAPLVSNGQTSFPGAGRMFARYSPDTKHWSTWQVLGLPLSTELEACGSGYPRCYTFSGELIVSQQDRREFDELCSEYQKLSGYSTDEACVRWILKSQPDFFATHLPFIGYVQFLYEAVFAGGQRIERLTIHISYGGARPPPGYDPDDAYWRFRAQ